MRKASLLFFILLSCTTAERLPDADRYGVAVPAVAPPVIDEGWSEAVVATDPIGDAANFLAIVAGWSGPSLDPDRPDYGKAYPDSGALISPNPRRAGGARTVRRVMPKGEARPATFAPFDTGGIFSLMTRTGDVDALVVRARAAGYEPYSEPYDLSFGDLQLRNVVIRGPDGLNLAAYEWVSPARDDVDDASVTAAFNSMQMVADLSAAKAFYVDGLGMEVITEGTFVDPGPLEETNFQVPWDTPRHYVILKAAGSSGESGRIELMQFEGVEGRAAPAWSPDALGIVELRWPVEDLDAKLAELAARGIEPAVGPTPIALPPYGVGRACTVVIPEQAAITFFELEE